MARHRLYNTAWGFESNCFVCEVGNERGLRLGFFHDDEAATVTAELCLDQAFSGTPSHVHGGVVLAVLDEAMAWASIALAGVFAVTRTVTANFVRPVRVGQAHRVEARVVGRPDAATVDLAAVVSDGAGRLCAEATAQFSVMTAERARAAMGPLRPKEVAYVRASPPGERRTAAEPGTEPA